MGISRFFTAAVIKLRLQRDFWLAVFLVLTSYALARHLFFAGHVSSWQTPLITIILSWAVVTIGLGDQIAKNSRSGRASDQLSWNGTLANMSENITWSMLSWSVGDPVIWLARAPGLLLIQIIFWQMLFSTEESERKGKVFVWLKYAAVPFLLTAVAVIFIPVYFLPLIRQRDAIVVLKSLTGAMWFWSACGLFLQIRKNMKSGVKTGRDYSLKLAALVEFSIASWLLHEFVDGHTGATMYLTMSISLSLNTVLLIQAVYYIRRWQFEQGQLLTNCSC